MLKKNSSLHAYSCRQEAELVCLLRGSDIFALQEVQLQHHQILQMLDWFGLSRLAFCSTIKESPQDKHETYRCIKVIVII